MLLQQFVCLLHSGQPGMLQCKVQHQKEDAHRAQRSERAQREVSSRQYLPVLIKRNMEFCIEIGKPQLMEIERHTGASLERNRETDTLSSEALSGVQRDMGIDGGAPTCSRAVGATSCTVQHIHKILHHL